MEKKMIKVSNRDAGSVGYYIPEKNIRRVFAPGETKIVPEDELQSLQYQPGGDFILRNLVIVQDKETLEKKINIQTEPEYFYDEKKIVEMLEFGIMDSSTIEPKHEEKKRRTAVKEEAPKRRTAPQKYNVVG